MNATNGFSESMRELVPSRKVPPLFALEPVAAETKTAMIAIAARVVPVSKRFVISCLPRSLRSEYRLVHRQ